MIVTHDHTKTMDGWRDTLNIRVIELRKAVEGEHGDPRGLFDEVQAMIGTLETAQVHVPDELREAVAALEAEIVEDFYDNLPV